MAIPPPPRSGPATVDQKCRTVFECGGCCPDMKRFEKMAFAFSLPTLNISGSCTIWATQLLCSGFAIIGGGGTTYECVPATGFHCCQCGCSFALPQFGRADGPLPTCADGPHGFCTALASCTDFPGVSAPDAIDPSTGAPLPGGYLRQAGMSCVPGLDPDFLHGCNPPPGGNGAEDSPRTTGHFAADFVVDNPQCLGQGIYVPDGMGGNYVASAGGSRIGANCHCPVLHCRCGNFSAQFGPPLYHLDILGNPPIDPDGTITVTGIALGGPCPDEYSCPDHSGGGGMASMVAGRSAGGVLLGAAAPSAASLPPPDCVFYGRQLSGYEIQQLGLSRLRDWHECEHPQKPIGDPVCKCKGCGIKCPGYRPDV